ncbi:Uma2 family endonuclease [Synechococcus sp. PCC 7336]|uniref:Uma2 family endonuclease n=1 Tax=Synechococcus sp. PCC 7336 TaxID=195250 RepID=UPI0003465111|nr:Uma2 family endonuclease [Synechococcus sp. PCC 7336]
MTSIILAPAVQLTDWQFEQICQQNPLTSFELSAKGELIVVPPVGGEAGRREFALLSQLGHWAARNPSGIGFSSQTIFQLPNGAKRMPDFAWVWRERWDKLTPEQKRGFPPLAPDFVVELRSPSDSLQELQAKMQEYARAGVPLGWLIDPIRRTVEVYQPDVETKIVRTDAIAGDPLLPGLTLDLLRLWQN